MHISQMRYTEMNYMGANGSTGTSTPGLGMFTALTVYPATDEPGSVIA